MTRQTARPSPISAGLAMLAAVSAVLFVANGPVQRKALGIGFVGVVAVALGLEAIHRDHGLVGVLVGTGGIAGVLGGLGLVFARTWSISPKLELLPGIVGLLVLGLGLGAVYPGYERWFVTAGTGTILLSVFVSGLLQDATVGAMLAGTTATVVAWDLGEQAINMGEQVGRGASTWRVELVHGAGGLVVGALAVAIALVIDDVGVTGLPIAALSILLGAGVVLSAALYN